ncbi:MAG TPA: glycosyltransferase family 2 protein, partial [Candidatus Aminicenantes bacterium]|nr:glycosyltransferase family 2 protein [Candidatus Aminicenantes bacterium]
WNKRDDVLECVESLKKNRGPAIDIVVVDNASSDGTAEAIRSLFPEVKLIVNERNLGGTGGFNTGLRHVLGANKHRYAWLLDSDVVVGLESLTGLWREFTDNPATAVTGSLILKRDAPAIVQEMGAMINLKTFEYELQGRDLPLSAIGMETQEVDYVPACSLLVDLDKVRHVGLMDEGYFLYFDDIEWCMRFKRAGYRVVATPASRVWHRGGGRARTSYLPLYYWWRNACHFFMTLAAGTSHVESFFQVFLKRVFVAINLARGQGKINSSHALVAAMWDAILTNRGKAPPSRSFPLDINVIDPLLERLGSQPAFLCPELDFYTAFRPLVEAGMESGTNPDLFTSVTQSMLPDWLVERVRLRPDEEVDAIPSDSTVVCLSPHLITQPHPQEVHWQKMLRARGNKVCFVDQHSNVVWGFTALNSLRNSLVREWQWFYDWITPLLSERMAEMATKVDHD